MFELTDPCTLNRLALIRGVSNIAMSFKFTWPHFSKEFIDNAKIELTEALNKGDKPASIADYIYVKELHMGSKVPPSRYISYKPPELEILEVGELDDGRFRGMFKLVYTGDAFIGLQTKVQANPLINYARESEIGNKVGMLSANSPLVVPMQLKISNFRLRGVISLVLDAHHGITLVFKNDPLEVRRVYKMLMA
jgi:mitochondrial distribution and morphology protein 34